MILLFVCQYIILSSQDVFVKTINKGENRLARQVTTYNDRVFILSTGVCDDQYECSLIMEIDDTGEVLWEKTLKWLDVASKSMIIENNTIYLSGNHPNRDRWYWHHMSADGGDSLATYEIIDVEKDYQLMSNFGMVKHGDKFCIYGSGEMGTYETSLLYFVDEVGELDTLLDVFTTDIDSDPWEVIQDNEGNLVVFIRYREEGKDRQRLVSKINQEKEIIWSYLSEEEKFNAAVPDGAILDDGTIVYITGELFHDEIEWLRAINLDSTIAWVYESPDFDGYVRNFHKIQTLSDGSILGTGEWGRFIGSPIFWKLPWLIKISSDGELIWERAFYLLNDDGDEALRGLFFDAVELSDGSIISVGSLDKGGQFPSEILIARLDSEGCLIGYCPVLKDISGILTDIEAIELDQLNIYPNPVSNILNIEGEEVPRQVTIYSMDGSEMVRKFNSDIIDVSLLLKGMYLLKIHFDDGIETLAFIKT